jgi:O-antigen ligase
LYGVVGLLLFGPLAFGAVESWSMAIMQAGAGLLFALWALREVGTGKVEAIGNPLFLPMLLFAALILWQLATGQTAYPQETSSTVLSYCAYGVLCFLVVQCLRKKSQVRILGVVFSGYGLTIALFALLQGLASNGKLYWLRTPQSDGWIYGPYLNHNHYAGLMEMLTPIPLVGSFCRSVRSPCKGRLALVAAVMASTIFLSGSRGGMVALTAEIVLLATFLVGQRKTWKATIALGVFLFALAGLLAWLGGQTLADRIISIHSATRTELTGGTLSDGTRLLIDHGALKMFERKPALGWGLGVFPYIYPQFSTLPIDVPVVMAHNDYLQLLAEMGVFGFATVIWFLLTPYRYALTKLRHWPPDTNTAVTLASILGVTGILVHSFLDFNLHIPANAALFYVLCAITCIEIGSETGEKQKSSHCGNLAS